MSVLPVELREGAYGERWLAEFDRSLEAARSTLARRMTLRYAAATLWLVILLSCTWVALVRFTLLDIPQWPALLFPLAWLLSIFIVRRTRRIGVGESARYLDRALSLDERVATSLELVRSTPVAGMRSSRLRVPRAMLDDTAFHLKAKRALLPSGWAYRLKRGQLLAMAISLLILFGAVFLPTPLDQVRAERADLQRAVRDEIARVEQLRAELIERPGLDDASKTLIEQELQRLLDVLASPQLDRSALLAAIADTQERLQALSPDSPTDFLGVLAAARTVQNATVAAARNAPVQFTLDIAWSPDDFPDLSDLGKAADAARALSGWIKNLNTAQLRGLSEALQRAEGQATSEDAALAQALLDSSKAVAAKDVEKSATSLQSVSQSFLDADKRWQLAGAVEKALADLDDGRQTLARAGAPEVKKGQVGFRRPGAPGNNQGGIPAAVGQGTDDAGTGDGDAHGVTKNDASAFGPSMGMNSPDYNLSTGSQSNGGQNATGASGQGAGQGGGSQGGTAGSQNGGGQPGNTAGGGTGDSQGTFGGQMNGPIGGAGGAISQVENPQGRGISSQTDHSATDPGEEIYIPPADEPDSGPTGGDTGTGEVPGQAALDDPRQEGIEGRGGEGGETPVSTTQRGTGVRREIRTPYKEVYGDYAEQATRALEGAYIPADAKEYVKEYFTELGK